MSSYDFEHVIFRYNAGSAKWDEMRECLGDYPKGIIPFSLADMDFPVPPEIIHGLKKYLDSNTLGYSKPTKLYYDAVVDWFRRRHNWEVNPQWICMTHGVINAFFTAVRAYTEPGDGVILMTPVYYPMYDAIKNNGRRLVENKLIRRNRTFEIDFEDLECKAAEPNTKLLILCSPHNPSGRVWTENELRRVAEICLENDVLVISDEIHFDIVRPGKRHIVFANLGDKISENCVVCTAASKTFSIPGLQTSNVIIKNPLLREKFVVEQKKTEANPKCNCIGVEATRLAYCYSEKWLDEFLKVMEDNVSVIEQFFAQEYPMIEVYQLEGTYLLWIDFRALELDGKTLSKVLRQEALIFLDDGFVFGSAGEGFERWNIACPTRYIEEALDRLKPVLDKYIKGKYQKT